MKNVTEDDDGTRFGWRKHSCVAVQETGKGLVVVLAEEIGFADGFLRLGSVHRE